MHRAGNCRMYSVVLVVNKEDADKAIELLNKAGESAFRLGEIIASTGAPDVLIK